MSADLPLMRPLIILGFPLMPLIVANSRSGGMKKTETNPGVSGIRGSVGMSGDQRTRADYARKTTDATGALRTVYPFS
jgi:hypothetical protein